MAKLPPSNRRRLTSPVSARSDGAGPTHDGRWWAKERGKDSAAALWDTVSVLDGYSRQRHLLDAYYVGLYEGQSPWWLGAVGAQAQPAPATVDYRGRGMTTNLGKSVIDTISALLAKNIDELRVLTSGGTWKQQTRARGLTKYLSGVFAAMGYHQAKQRTFIDGCRSHKAAVKFWKDPKFKKVRCGRARPSSLLWNDLEGDSPANLYQKEPFPRTTLCSWFPKYADEIEKAPQSVNPVNPAVRRPTGLAQHADMVDVIEGWHISPDPDVPGVHLMIIQGKNAPIELVREDWKHQFFPFADFCWDDADEGWGGLPLMQSLKGYQAEINYRLRMERVGRARSLAKIFVEAGSEITEDHLLGDEVRGVVKYKGTPPTYSNPPAVANDHLPWLQWYFDKAFGEAGISLLNSHGEKPAGLDSGQALREYNDITATRQVVKGQRLERQTELAGRIVIALTKELAEEVGDLKVLAQGQGRNYEEIHWKDVDMEIDDITLRTFAVSALPTHAVGRIQALTEMIKGGLLPQDEIQNGLGLKLLNFPDLEKIITLQTANNELAQMQADSALYEGKYVGPEPYQDLKLLRDIAQKELLHAYTLTGVPDDHLRKLERLCSQANSMYVKATQPPPAPAPAPGAPLGAPPGMQPPPGMQLPEIQPGVNMVQPALPSATPARTEVPLAQ